MLSRLVELAISMTKKVLSTSPVSQGVIRLVRVCGFLGNLKSLIDAVENAHAAKPPQQAQSLIQAKTYKSFSTLYKKARIRI